jgi:hypothetical protein
MKEVDPAHYDVTAIIKHLGGMKSFRFLSSKTVELAWPSERPQADHELRDLPAQNQIALGLPKEMSRMEMAEACLEMEERRFLRWLSTKSRAG